MVDDIEPGGLRDPLPTFPVVPPRKWNKDYFRNKVASEDEVKAAISGLHGDGSAKKEEGTSKSSRTSSSTSAQKITTGRAEGRPSERSQGKTTKQRRGTGKRETLGSSKGRGEGADLRSPHAGSRSAEIGGDDKVMSKTKTVGKVEQSQSAASGSVSDSSKPDDNGGLLKSILRYVGASKGLRGPANFHCSSKDSRGSAKEGRARGPLETGKGRL